MKYPCTNAAPMAAQMPHKCTNGLHAHTALRSRQLCSVHVCTPDIGAEPETDMTRPTIGGALDLAALSALSDPDDRMAHFRLLSRNQQAAAIHRLAATGMTDHGIASATRLSVEMVRRILGEHRQETAA